MRVLALAGMLFGSTVANAQTTVDITLNQLGTDAGLDEAALESALTDAVGGALNIGTQAQHDAYIRSMVEATSISARGMGVDYASNMEKFVFGGSFATGAHEAGFTFNRGKDYLPKGGYAAQLTLMAGLNLGMGGDEKGFFDRIRLYANGMSIKTPSQREFAGSLTNVGGHLQIKLIGGPNAKAVEWGGIDLTSGFEYTAYTLELRQERIPISGPAGDTAGDLTWTATGQYGLENSVMTVPVELSTNVRVFVLTGYLGAALDHNIDSTGNSAAQLSGPIDAKLLAPDGTTFDGNLGSATVRAAADGTATTDAFRLFLGAQANILVLKAFGHLNVAPLNGALSGHLGVRVAL